MWESTVSSLSNWMDGGIIHTPIEMGGRADLRTTKQSLHFEYISFSNF